MTLLVTGACGFIGSWIVRQLMERGLRPILTDLSRDLSRLSFLAPRSEDLPFVAGDITAPDFLVSICRDYQVNRILHLAAWQIPLCRADPIGGAMVNVIGTVRVFETARALNGQVERIVYASSAAVFGPPLLYPDRPVRETTILWPATHYGAYKVCNELTANAYWSEWGIHSAGLRPHTVYGFGRDVGVTADITSALKALVLGQPFRIRFGGLVDLQYARDVAEAFVRCVLADLPGARIYNLRGHPVTVSEIVREMVRLVPEGEGLLSFDEKPLPILAECDDSALQKDVGPVPITPVSEGFEETLQQFRKLKEKGQLTLPS